jgi:hypothetical protein
MVGCLMSNEFGKEWRQLWRNWHWTGETKENHEKPPSGQRDFPADNRYEYFLSTIIERYEFTSLIGQK